MISEFINKKILLITKHKKEKVIQPLMENEIGCRIICDSNIDTDQFGTFVRDIPRILSQTDAAREKIIAGLKGSGCTIGIASEGSFGPHPYYPIPWNHEIVLIYDIESGLEVTGVYDGPDTNFAHFYTSNYDEAVMFAKKIGFPEHHLILRPDDEYSLVIYKDIDSWEKLDSWFRICKEKSSGEVVFMETDMRAQGNPTRMSNIEKATVDLIQKLKMRCPCCGAPGFKLENSIPGLKCELCGAKTKLIEKSIYSCYRCKYKVEKRRDDLDKAPATFCDYCNP